MDTTDRNDSDTATQAAVLSALLVVHPSRLSAEELRLRVLGGAEDFTSTDAHDRAISELTRNGLVRVDGHSIVPTYAARCFAALPL